MFIGADNFCDRVFSIALTKDSKLIVTAGSTELKIWDVATGAALGAILPYGSDTPQIP